MAIKTCPKCPNSQMKEVTVADGVIPAITSDSKISETDCFPVVLFECPRCHLVEIYRKM